MPGEYHIHVIWYHAAATVSAWYRYIDAGADGGWNAGGCTLWYLYYFVNAILRCIITQLKNALWLWYWTNNIILLYEHMMWLFFVHCEVPFKGTVSRELRHRLPYIIRKLFSRPIVTSHKIYILLKGQFTINKKPFSVS